MKRLIFHVDVNSAFLSWEAARRVALGLEDIRLIPSAIGGDRDKRTGVILAKSIPAKKFNIKTGEPVASALRKYPSLYLVKPDFHIYEENSQAFMDICRRYAPIVEKYSIDECFLDMSGTENIYPDPLSLANTIKNTIFQKLNFTVNIGISTNKLLAKMASDFEKPDKVHTLFPDEIRTKLWPLPIRDLFSIGTSTADKLERINILTIGDLAKTDINRLKPIIGEKLSRQIHSYANGIDSSPVLVEPEEAKCYGNSITLERDVRSSKQAHNILFALSDSVASRIRADSAKAFCITVSIRSNDFKNKSHQKKLKEATDITSEIYGTAKILFNELWDRHTPLRLLGISLSNITRENYMQETLFADKEREKARKLDTAVDIIRKRYGTDAISRGSIFNSNIKIGKKYKTQIEKINNPNKSSSF